MRSNKDNIKIIVLRYFFKIVVGWGTGCYALRCKKYLHMNCSEYYVRKQIIIVKYRALGFPVDSVFMLAVEYM